MLHVASWTLTPFVLAPSRCAIFPLVQECHKFALAAVQRFAKSEGVTVEEVKVDLDRRRYFTPAQAIEYGLIDRVIQKGSDVFERKDYEAERMQDEAMRAGAGRSR